MLSPGSNTRVEESQGLLELGSSPYMASSPRSNSPRPSPLDKRTLSRECKENGLGNTPESTKTETTQDYLLPLHLEDAMEVTRNPSMRLSQLQKRESEQSDFGIRSILSCSDCDPTGHSKVSTDINNIVSSSSIVSDRSGSDGPSWDAIVSGICLCANTVVGAGTLAVPLTMRLTGYVLYHWIIIAVFFANFVSCRWLATVAHELPKGVPRSYEGIAHHYLGGEADFAFSMALILGGFALSMAYMLFITTSLVSVLKGVLVQWVPKGCVATVVMFVVGLGIVLPLLMLRDISKLKYTAKLAVFSLLCTSFYVVWSGVLYIQENGSVNEGFVQMSFNAETIEAVPMVVSAYSCQLLVIPIYDSLGEGRSPALMNKIMAAALGLAACIYEAVGFAGYMEFGADVDGNILASIAKGHRSPVSSVISVSMALTLICHVPTIVWPLRTCVISAWRYLVIGFDPETDQPSAMQWRGASTFIMFVVLALAMLVPNVKTALSVVGSIGGAFIVFIYPAGFHLAVVHKVSSWRSWFTCEYIAELMMMTIGIVVGLVCFTVSIYNSLTKG